MAVRVECKKEDLQLALEGMIASLKRAQNNKRNAKFSAIIEQDLATAQHALHTMTEIK